MTRIQLDARKLLGFRLTAGSETMLRPGSAVGAKQGVKVGAKAGGKLGAKRT